jgi:hypothetical protein
MDVQSITPSNNFISHRDGAGQARRAHSHLPSSIDWEQPRDPAAIPRRARGIVNSRRVFRPMQHRKPLAYPAGTRRHVKRLDFSGVSYLYTVKMMVLIQFLAVKRSFCDARAREIANGRISRAGRAPLRLFTRQTRIVDGGSSVAKGRVAHRQAETIHRSSQPQPSSRSAKKKRPAMTPAFVGISVFIGPIILPAATPAARPRAQPGQWPPASRARPGSACRA